MNVSSTPAHANAPSPMFKTRYASALGMPDHEKDALKKSVRGLYVSPKVAHSVAINYLRLLKSSSKDVERSIIPWLRKNKEFEDAMFKATRDAIVFSTLAELLPPDFFCCALTTIEALRWPQLHKMRKKLFLMGVDMRLEAHVQDQVKITLINTNAQYFLKI